MAERTRQSDAAWARRFDGTVRAILASSIGTARRDTAEVISSDLAVWSVTPHPHVVEAVIDRDLVVISRVRHPGYPLDEYTLRSSRPKSAKDVVVELQRVRDHFVADFYLYAHSESEAGNTLAAWTLVDLDVFRREQPAYRTLVTRDGSAEFAVFALPGPSGLVRAHSNPAIDQAAKRQAREDVQRKRDAEADRRRAESEAAQKLWDELTREQDDEVQA